MLTAAIMSYGLLRIDSRKKDVRKGYQEKGIFLKFAEHKQGGCIVGRYIREMDLQLPENEVRELIDGFLKENGFYRGEWQGQIYWTADYGINMPIPPIRIAKAYIGLYFFDYTYENGKLHFEAWMRDGKKKEIGLTGWYLWQIKEPYTGLVSKLEKELIDKLPQDSELRLQAGDSTQIENSKRRMGKAHLILGVVGILVMIATFSNVLRHLGRLLGL